MKGARSLWFFVLGLATCFGGKIDLEFDVRKCGRVHITVGSSQDSFIELNWNTNCDHPLDIKPTVIALFRSDPLGRDESELPVISIRASLYPEGHYKTGVKFRDPWLPGNWEYQENITHVEPGPHCFPYWIASYRDGQIIHSQCLGIQPTWMSDNRYRRKFLFCIFRAALGPQRIGNAFIPGTHNSGSYFGSATFLQNYILNQDRSVWTQLVYGIRYLDFRVGYYENEGFYINHDLVQVTKLQPILRQVRTFLELAPLELVIVDFHRFPYPTAFTQNIHHRLVRLIEEELGRFALSPEGIQAGKGPSFNEVWIKNKNLIICYGQRDIARDYKWLWNPLQQYWADTRNVNVLKSFLGAKIKDHNNNNYNPMWALMAELTPQITDIVFRVNNLRKLADDVNRKLTVWFRDEWARDTNIVATDYFLGNDLINVAIDVNANR